MKFRKGICLAFGLLVSFPLLASEKDIENTIAISLPTIMSKPRVSYERYIGDKLGLAVYGGIGNGKANTGDTYKLWEIGGQLTKYFVREFVGPHVGAEIKYVSGARLSDSNPVVNYAYGLYVGQKMSLTANNRFFMLLNLGVQYIDIHDFGTRNSGIDLLGDVKAAWSF